jgi:hypothetical protein
VKIPDDLRARVTADLKPVRPFLSPWQRALVLAPAAVLAWAVAPGVLGIRGDITSLGPWLAWGGSLFQFAIAIALIVAALREAIPAEALAGQTARLLLAASVVITIVLAIATNAVSPEPMPRTETFASWLFCWKGAVGTGAPLVLLLAVVLARGLPMRPGLAGALAGMGSGTAVDGGWRLYCNYSNPTHVIGSHGGAVLALTFVGILGAIVVTKIRNRRR